MSIWKRIRSASTGRFVGKAEAEKRPAETVTETVKVPKTPWSRLSRAERDKTDDDAGLAARSLVRILDNLAPAHQREFIDELGHVLQSGHAYKILECLEDWAATAIVDSHPDLAKQLMGTPDL